MKTTVWAIFAFMFLALFSVPGSSAERVVSRQTVNRYELPESYGHMNLAVNGQTAGGYEYRISTQRAQAPDYRSPVIRKFHSNLGVGVSVGLFERLDLGVLAEQSNDIGLLKLIALRSIKYRIKYQFLGPTISQATQGDVSLALMSSISRAREKVARNRTNSSTRHSLDVTNFDSALLAGIRLTDHSLLYGGPFITMTYYEARYHYEDSDQEVSARGKGSGKTWGNHLGLAFFAGRNWNIKGEVARSRIRLENSRQKGTQVGILVTKVMRLRRGSEQ